MECLGGPIADGQRAELDRDLPVGLPVCQHFGWRPLRGCHLPGKLVILDADVIDQADHLAAALLGFGLAEPAEDRDLRFRKAEGTDEAARAAAGDPSNEPMLVPT